MIQPAFSALDTFFFNQHSGSRRRNAGYFLHRPDTVDARCVGDEDGTRRLRAPGGQLTHVIRQRRYQYSLRRLHRLCFTIPGYEIFMDVVHSCTVSHTSAPASLAILPSVGPPLGDETSRAPWVTWVVCVRGRGCVRGSWADANGL